MRAYTHVHVSWIGMFVNQAHDNPIPTKFTVGVYFLVNNQTYDWYLLHAGRSVDSIDR